MMNSVQEIVDWHSHIWLPEHLGREWGGELDEKYPHMPSEQGSVESHAHAMDVAGIGTSIVIALHSLHLGLHIPNEYVADYVATAPSRLVGVASVDPNDPGAVPKLRDAVRDMGLKGLKLSPPYQNFHPHSTAAMNLYREASELGIFVIFHQGAVTHRRGVLDHAQPVLLDRVAREFPELRIVIAHMGQPWYFEVIPLLRKHPNVFADVSARCTRPNQLASILLAAHDYSALDKILFGSDFPTFDIEEHVRGLRRAAHIAFAADSSVADGIVDALLYERPLEMLGVVS